MSETPNPAASYVHEITTLRGKVLKTRRITPGVEPVVVYQRPFGISTTEQIQVEPDGRLASVVLFGGTEVLEDRGRDSIGSSRRFFLDGLKPRFEIVRPVQTGHAPTGTTSL
jgi:hypothetical protein